MQCRLTVATSLAMTALAIAGSLRADSEPVVRNQAVPQDVEIVMLTGDPLPGQDGKAQRFGPPAMAGIDHMVFRHGATLPTLQAIYHHKSGNISPIAIRDDTTIDNQYEIGGGPFGTEDGEATINEHGQILFNANITPIDAPGSDDALIAGSPDGDLGLVVRDGDPSPDGNGLISNRLSQPGVINQAGQMAFFNWLYDTEGGSSDNRAVFFRESPGDPLEIVARKGDPVPGSDEFTLDDPSTPVLNDSGQVTFLSDFQEPGPASAGVFTWDGGAIQVVSMTGDPWPDCNSADLGRHFRFDFNNAGQTLFTTTCPGWGASSSTARLVFMHEGGSLNLLASLGDSIPGLTDETYSSFWRVRLNNAGHAIFNFRYIGGSGIGLHDGSLKTIAASGMPAPGGGTFRTTNQAFRNFNINDFGQVVFSASVDDVDGDTRSGVFFYNGHGDLQQILRHDDPLLGSAIESFSIRYGWPRGSRAIDDRGRVGISFRLADDRRGILVSNAGVISDQLFEDRFEGN